METWEVQTHITCHVSTNLVMSGLWCYPDAVGAGWALDPSGVCGDGLQGSTVNNSPWLGFHGGTPQIQT